MRILRCASVRLFLVALACSLAVSSAVRAAEKKSKSSAGAGAVDARLFVSRSADFGTIESLHVFVDGVKVADLDRNQSYGTALRPGKHMLSVETTPNGYAQTPVAQRPVDAKPGKTYAYTAVWKDPEHASLRKSRRS
jgi:hypothetical protein